MSAQETLNHVARTKGQFFTVTGAALRTKATAEGTELWDDAGLLERFSREEWASVLSEARLTHQGAVLFW